jgi:hypothetical protein
LERLEARDCPAFTINYTSSLLVIRGHPTLPFVNPGDGLQLKVLAAGQVQVLEVGGATTLNYGSYAPPQSIQVLLDFTDRDVTVDLGGKRLPSNLTINLGKGDLNLLTPNFTTIQNGNLGGFLTIQGGSGGELINLGRSAGLGALPVKIDGDTNLSLSPNHSILGDTLFVNAGSELRGRLTGVEVDNIDVGELTGPVARVDKDVVLSVSQSRNVGRLDIFGEIDGNATFVGSPVIDPFFADSVIVEDSNPVPGLVRGNLTAVLGSGQGFLDIHPLATVDGSLTLTGALGNDTVNLDGSVLGSASLNVRSGDNTVDFTGTVLGSMTIRADNGNNDLTTFTGAVGGSLYIQMGNGSDSFVFNGSVQGPTLNYQGGNGGNSVVINGSNAFALVVQTGTGADTVQITNNDGAGSATIDLGLGGNNVFLPPPVITFPLILRNFP